MNQPVYELEHLVEFYETDAAGIVHFSNFFRYMEKCEHAFMRSFDEEAQKALTATDSGWPRVHAECDYLAPAHFGDLLTIRMNIAEIGQRSLTYQFQILCKTTIVAEGSMIIAHVIKTDDGIQSIPLPGALKKALESSIAG